MKISARNQIRGTVLSVTHGAVNATVKIDIGGGNVITSSITNEAIGISRWPRATRSPSSSSPATS